MKGRKVILNVFIAILLIVSVLVFDDYRFNAQVITNDTSSEKINNNSKNLAVMLQESGGGYRQAADNETWSNENYHFNPELSRCENSGKVIWDYIYDKVYVSTNTSDKCYVYYDLYDSFSVTSVTMEYLWNPTASCECEPGPSKYQYRFTNITLSDSNLKMAAIEFLPGNLTEWQKLATDYERDAYTGFDYDTYSTTAKLVVKTADGRRSAVYNGTLSSSSACFAPGTLVWTNEGNKKIEDIKIGDLVYSYNEETNKIELKNVSRTYVRNAASLYKVAVGNEIIKITGNHEVYQKRSGAFGSWVAIEKLKPGSSLYTPFGPKMISSMKEINGQATVYNFDVEGNHNYYVTNEHYLVHNADYGCYPCYPSAPS